MHRSQILADLFKAGISADTPVQMGSELSTEEKSEELEYVVFAILNNEDELQSATSQEHQEQLEYRVIDPKTQEGLGTIRSRMYDGGKAFELTVKGYHKDRPGCIENTLTSDADMHQAFSLIASRRLEKIRYVFPFTVEHMGESIELKWEVDRFIRPDGEYEPYVKIDLEVPHGDIELPELPFDLDDVIKSGNGIKVDDDDWDRVDAIFKRVTGEVNVI